MLITNRRTREQCDRLVIQCKEQSQPKHSILAVPLRVKALHGGKNFVKSLVLVVVLHHYQVSGERAGPLYGFFAVAQFVYWRRAAALLVTPSCFGM